MVTDLEPRPVYDVASLMRRWAFLMALLLGSAVALSAASEGGTPPVPLPLFPRNNWWNTDVSAAPVDVNSANFIQFMAALGYTDPSLSAGTPIRAVHVQQLRSGVQ